MLAPPIRNEGPVYVVPIADFGGRGTPSSGVEILSSDGIIFEDNTMTGYATALQLGGNNHVFNRNTLVSNSIAVQMGGTGYKLTGTRSEAIAPARIRLPAARSSTR